MKFYAKKVIHNILGEPFKEQGPSNTQIDLTLGHAAANVLMGRCPADAAAPANLKLVRYKLATRILDYLKGKDTNPLGLGMEEMGMVKGRILEAYDTPVAGKWCEMVEEEENAGTPKAVSKPA